MYCVFRVNGHRGGHDGVCCNIVAVEWLKKGPISQLIQKDQINQKDQTLDQLNGAPPPLSWTAIPNLIRTQK